VYRILREGNVLCTLKDWKRPLFRFGQRADGCDDRDCLWLFRGCCEVCMAPYREGKHVAWSALDLIPPARRLLDFHKLGLVHGDIRCCNIVFGPNGGLIDDDFGGRVDRDDPTKSPKYPPGFKFYSVPDGFRRGEEGGTITMRDDWSAMTSVVFGKHEVVAPAIAQRNAEDELNALRIKEKLTNDMNELKKFFLGKGPDDIAEIEAHAIALIEFLSSAHDAGWTVAPNPTMLEKLESWGLDVAPPDDGSSGGGPRTLSSPATGSPPKENLPAVRNLG
jgi:serine/threonine protein kinase